MFSLLDYNPAVENDIRPKNGGDFPNTGTKINGAFRGCKNPLFGMKMLRDTGTDGPMHSVTVNGSSDK